MDLTGLWRRSRHGRDEEFHAETDLVDQVSAAHREWVSAQQYFQYVSEPALVDQAVQSINEAEQKYTSLLRRLRETGGQG